MYLIFVYFIELTFRGNNQSTIDYFMEITPYPPFSINVFLKKCSKVYI